MLGEKIPKNGKPKHLPTLEELVADIERPAPQVLERPHSYPPNSLGALAIVRGYRIEERDRRPRIGKSKKTTEEIEQPVLD